MRVPTLVPAAVAALLAGPARAAAETAPAFQNPPLAAGNTLTGDWFGLRSTLAQAGITVRADLAADCAWLSHDGSDGERRYLDQRFQATASLDTATAVGFAGGTLAATFQSIGGDDGPGHDEPLQRYSSIAAPHRDQLAELWYRQRLFDGALALKLGKADVSEDFATSAVAAPLLNRSFAYAPSIFTLPAYPDPATGLNVAFAYDGWHAKAGIYDGRTAAGEPTGPRWLHRPGAERFAIAELGATWGAGGRGGGVAVGAWRHTATFACFDGGESDGTGGWYALLDGLLWPAPGNAGGGISGFVEGGLADPHVTRFARHLAVGVVSSDPGGVAHTGAIGAAATWVGTSREEGSGCDADELVIEGFLSYQVTAWMTVTPDLQWVSHPGGALSATDRWTAVVRGDVTF